MGAVTRLYVMTLVILIVLWLSLGQVERAVLEDYPPMVSIASNPIKKAMLKAGPLHKYHILEDGTLEINRGDGKWLRLRY